MRVWANVRVLGAVVLAGPLFLAGGAQAAVARPVCVEMQLSPFFRTDATAFCYAYLKISATKPVRFFVSTDGLRSWRETAASGLVGDGGEAYGQLLVSPRFDRDRTIYLASTTRLYVSTDYGESFTVASALAGSYLARDSLSIYVEPGLAQQVAVALADDDASMRIAPPVHVPVVGSLDDDQHFVFAPRRDSVTGFALANRDLDPTLVPRTQPVLYECDALLTCLTPRHTFPERQRAVGGFAAPDFAESRLLFVTTEDQDAVGVGEHLWRSTDGGATFTEDAGMMKWRSEVARTGGSGAQLGVYLAGSGRVYLRRVSYGSRADLRDQILRSDDGGRTWKLLARTGPDGNLPWSAARQDARAAIFAPARKLLVALALDSRRGYLGPYCSRDDGRTWRRGCA